MWPDKMFRMGFIVANPFIIWDYIGKKVDKYPWIVLGGKGSLVKYQDNIYVYMC